MHAIRTSQVTMYCPHFKQHVVTPRNDYFGYMQVVFVRVHHAHVVTDQPLVRQALRYESWQDENKKQGANDISSNAWMPAANKQLVQLRTKRLECFDSEFYINSSPLEFKSWTPLQAFDHFLKLGFKEGRPFQFHC